MFRPLRLTFVLAAFAFTGAALAQVRDYSLFRTNAYVQTGSATVNYDGSYLGAQLGVTDANDYAAASFDGQAMSLDASNLADPRYFWGSNYYSSQADLEADFPYPGSYDFTTDANNQPADSATLDDDVARFSSDVPLLPEYDALQGILPGSSIDLHVGGFAPGIGTDLNLTYYQVLDLSTSLYVVDSVNANTPFTIGLSGSDLLPGHDYLVTVVYSSRVTGSGNGFNGVGSTLGYDNRTDFTFSVSPVPEPSAFLAIGVGMVALIRRRRN